LIPNTTSYFNVIALSNVGPSDRSSNASVQTLALPHIEGLSTLCTGNYTFSLNNLVAGYSISWNNSPNLLYTSSSGLSASFKVIGPSGTGYINASIIAPSGQSLKLANKSVQIGEPCLLTIIGDSEIECGCHYFYSAHGDPCSIINPQWSVTEPLSIIGPSNGTHCMVQASGSGMGWIYYTMSNICGSQRAELLVEVNCMGFKSYPNPTSNILTIEIDNEEEVNQDKLIEVRIYDKLMMLKKHKKFAGTKTTLNMSDLKPDVYIIQVKIGDEISEKKIIVSDK